MISIPVRCNASGRHKRNCLLVASFSFAALTSVFDTLDNKTLSPFLKTYTLHANCDTRFRYLLQDESSKNVAKVGLEDFKKSLPYVFAFIPLLSEVKILDSVNKTTQVYQREGEKTVGYVKIVTMSLTSNSKKDTTKQNINIAIAKNSNMTLAREVFIDSKSQYFFKERDYLSHF